MNYELGEYITQQLERFPEQDVLVHCERQGLRFTFGFFVWSGYSHTQMTITELRQDGFEKEDIRELRSTAKKILVVEDIFRKFEVSDE